MRALVLAEVNKKKLEDSYPSIEFEYLGYASDFIVLDNDRLAEIISSYDILISEFDTIDKRIIDRATSLKLLICCRGGIDTVVDVQYAQQKKIVVRNTPGRNATAVAEYVIGQIISIDRYLSESDNLIHEEVLQSQQYAKPSEYRDSLWGMDATSPYHVFRGRGLQNLRLGIIGYGRVGRAVAEIARSVGMRVLVYDHSLQTLIPELDIVDFDTLLHESDIVSLHCTNRNHEYLFSDAQFSKMKPDSWLINTARGDLIDEDALVRALENKRLAKAILDVTSQEPLPLGSPLISAPNLVLTPHIAGATDVVIDNVTKMVVMYIEQFLTEQGNPCR